jgi:pimeloyl-ACP methyl ester carboxylesterase
LFDCRLRPEEAARIRADGIPAVIINGARDGTTPLWAAASLAATLDCPVRAIPDATHAGLLIQKAEVVLQALEAAVLSGRQVSTEEERAAAGKAGEAAVLSSSFYF